MSQPPSSETLCGRRWRSPAVRLRDRHPQAIDQTLQANHWVKIAIGMNMVVEGLALAAFHNMRRATTCPLLRSITEGVLRDESRHVAFGNVYVGETIRAKLDPALEAGRRHLEAIERELAAAGAPGARTVPPR